MLLHALLRALLLLLLGAAGSSTAPTAFEAAASAAAAAEARLRKPAGAGADAQVRRADELESLADARSLMRERAASVSAREEALALRLAAGAPAARTAVALAAELQASGDYAAALRVVAEAQQRVAAATAPTTALPGLGPLLLRLEANLLDCRGDTVAALGRVARARKAERAAQPAAAPSASDTLQHVRLLRKVLLSDAQSAALPPAILQGLREEWARQQRDLVGAGPWRDALQLPKVYVPGLSARPWHSVAAHFPLVAPLEALLVAARPALLAELRELERRGLTEREEECIHGGGGGGALWPGAWTTYMVNAHWRPRLDANGCSLDTPAACALLRDAAALGVARVVRGGFSVVSARAHLHPHCGLTNAQLKMHLGLEVPVDAATGLGCARIRVGNETRRWREGAVLFFDDSFEHEVWHECDSGSPRSVFQLVIAHPELDALVASGAARDPFPRVGAPGARGGEL